MYGAMNNKPLVPNLVVILCKTEKKIIIDEFHFASEISFGIFSIIHGLLK